MRRLNRQLPFVLLVVWAVAGVAIIMRDPLEIGPDEGMEHAKALLVAIHPELLPGEWNDQPWFYSWVFGVVARADLTAMRLITLGMFVLLGCWMAVVLTRWHGRVAGFIGVACLLTWAGVSGLALSAMCEVPAAALMMLAGLIVSAHDKPGGRVWLCALAGVLAGVALAIKLTAALLLPFAVWLVLDRRAVGTSAGWGKHLLQRGLPFGLAALAAFGMCLLPGESWQGQILNPHLSASQVSEARGIAPGLGDFLPALGTCLFALAGLVFGRRLPDKRLLVAAGLALLLVAVVHSVHRPFWWFYRVHFAFPLSVLAGIGASTCWPAAGLSTGGSAFRMLVGLGASCLFLTTNLPFSLREFSAHWQSSRASGDGMLVRIASLREYPGFGFSYHNILLSRSGRLMVPGLTILSKKRHWVGAAPEDMVMESLVRHRPICLVLEERQAQKPRWRDWLSNEYVRTFSSDGEVLFVRKDLDPVSELIPIERIRGLGL